MFASRTPIAGALAALAFAALSSGCTVSATRPILPAVEKPSIARPHGTWTYTILHSFGAAGDGRFPHWLTSAGAMLYGVTENGGANDQGTVFSLTPAGVETPLLSFSGTDFAPSYLVAAPDGYLYGVSVGGGSYNKGIAFRLKPGGELDAFYQFGRYAGDGTSPYSIVYGGGNLYGLAYYGGTHGKGAIFKLTPGGKETLLHSFAGGADGINVEYGIAWVKGVVYGCTAAGGVRNDGTVFAVDDDGSNYRVIYQFGKTLGAIGKIPVSNLVVLGGNLYGTAQRGGKYDGGTVFQVTPSGAGRVVYSFSRASGKAVFPIGLAASGGKFYVTLQNGGDYGTGGIVSMNVDGTGTLQIHSFDKASTGTAPSGPVVPLGGLLYGTISTGGTHDDGIAYSLEH
ncbi:MAG: hypothetical protein JO199_13520 [Candidatus Eremiobacteraeota bacterium]|nr:hypothetical protein [Candidatus Eremiobacteraeota bacterium]